MSDEQISVQITADASSLKAELKEAADATKQGGEDIADGLGAASEGATEAEEKTGALTKTLREFKAEGAQAHRTAGFIAQELLEIVPGAEGARGALTGLISIGLEGFGIGAALTAAGVAVGYFAEESEKAEKNAQAIKEAYRSLRDDGIKAFEDIDVALRGTLNRSQTAARELAEKAKTAIKAAMADAKEAATDPSLARSVGHVLSFGLMSGVDTDRIEADFAKKAAIERAARDNARQADIESTKEELQRHQELLADELVMETAHGDQIAQIRARAAKDVLDLQKTTPDPANDAYGERATRTNDINMEASNEIARVKREALANDQLARIKNETETDAAIRAIDAQSSSEVERLQLDENSRLAALSVQAVETEQAMRLRSAETTSTEEGARIKAADLAVLKAKLDNIHRLEEATSEAADRAIDDAQRAARGQTHDEATGSAQNKYAKEMEALTEWSAYQDRQNALDQANGDRALADRLLSVQHELDEEAVALNKARAANLITETQFQAQLTRIQNEGAAQTKAILGKSNKDWENDFIKPITSQFESMLKGLITGTENFAEAGKKLFKGLVDVAISGSVKMLEEEIKDLLTSKVTRTAAAISGVNANAAVAGAGAAAAVADTPFIGPALAASAMAETSALVLGSMLPLASAAGGYDIPAGINPLVQAHAQEMILPASIANPLRENLANGSVGSGGNGGAGGGTAISVNISAIDAQSVKSFVSGSAFVNAIREAQRNGVF